MPENITSQVAKEQARRGTAARLLGTDKVGKGAKRKAKKKAGKPGLKNQDYLGKLKKGIKAKKRNTRIAKGKGRGADLIDALFNSN